MLVLRMGFGSALLVTVALWPNPVKAMGYDSLACPELAERRIGYFVDNGFCDPGKSDAKDCKPITAESLASLPEAIRTQVGMIIRTESRKGCASK